MERDKERKRNSQIKVYDCRSVVAETKNYETLAKNHVILPLKPHNDQPKIMVTDTLNGCSIIIAVNRSKG
jgi:hypothetical protein